MTSRSYREAKLSREKLFCDPTFVRIYLDALARAAMEDPTKDDLFWSALEEIADMNGWTGSFTFDKSTWPCSDSEKSTAPAKRA